uniref:Dystonin n=1 Tax=Cyanoderma ruficeps TaxID=181631 RepID=A0A8C3RHT7_9PASS
RGCSEKDSGNASYRCSMSSSADFSDEEDFSQRSGTVSPAPGDTLPWNLPKHERSKRKIQGGSVLDPAERAVLRIADERDKVQKKTFTKWINQHLMKVRKHVNDLYEDLRDGHNLISLLEVLSGDTLPREKGRMRFHRLQNVQIALDYLKKRQVKLVNIRNDDITDGNPKLTLGLIWTIILHFQISDIHVTGESEDMSAKERLLLWSQQTTEGYAGIRCENFTTCWRDGRLFNAIIHKYRPDLIDMNTVAVQSNLANLEHAFFVAEKLGVARLLDPEDVDVSSPDEKSVITYVSSLYDAFPKVPEGGEGISANDVEVKWVEYQNMVNYLMQWIRHHVTIMSDRTFPNNPVELKALYNQYLQFKETEIPPKETDKSKIKHLYKLLEVWIEFGRIKLSQGYHPNDIEKEWGKLIIAMLEREKTLRPEVERYATEYLTAFVNIFSVVLTHICKYLLLCKAYDFLLFIKDTKRLESGLQFQHEAEIAGYLLESENLLRQQVIDAQILIDGKYYQADQLVQRYFIVCLCLTPTLTSSSLTSGLSSGLASRLTPTITPAYPSGIPPRLIQSYVTGVDGGTLQTLKLMQIRKPLMKSAFVDQNLTEEEVNMKFVQDLLSWVEEMQVQLDRAEWGSDLPSVESHLENHKNVHKAIEELESSLKEAKISEIQMTAPLKLSYAEKLHKLESQYSKLLNTSRNQERHLDTLHNFVSRATRELIWLNEKEEEEVAYDWSERNPNITRKKEYHAELMRELDEKEEVIKSVQEIAEQLLLENHPARLTIEAYRAAMQTQWSWILQLCHCVEQHLRENAAYFEFFSDAKDAMEYLKNLKDTIYRKYSCDRSSSLHRLEDLVQESMEEKEQLLQYKSTVAGLVGRAKAIIQLKPRNPDCALKTSIPIKAICDYRQIEITIYKDDECVLANNSHRAKWKVISPSGNEAMVPSVCFTVPPPNKEAIDTANRIEQQFQNVLALWHESHVNMKSVVSWHYLTNEIEIKTMLPGEHQQVLSNLQSRFDDFVEDSQESKIFTSSDTAQLEREVNVCKQYYQELLKSAEREEQEESIYNLYISEVRNIRLRLESCEERLIRQIRTPMERDDVHENVLRISEQEKELDRLKDDLGVITEKCEEFFSQAAGSPSVPTLRSELNVVIQNMNQVYSMSSIFIDKLKTINLVLTNTQTAESLVKHYETKLCEEEAVTADKNNIENLMGTLKQWRSEVDEKRQTFHALEDELQKAKMISDQMFKMHKERDLDFDWHKEKVDQLAERWQNVHSQIENRFMKMSIHTLQMLVSEIEMKQSKIDECQKYSEQYSAAVKDYELQTMTYRAMVDSQQKSPVKRRRMQSSSDFIIQEFMDLRTRYTALVTLMTQYIKFAGDSLKRLEEEEVGYSLAVNQAKRTSRQTKIEKENQHEIQMLKNELTRSNQVSETLKQQIEDLNKWNTETKLMMKLTVEQLISGQKTIDEVQKSLEKFLTKPTAIAGLYLESSKEILSFALAAKRKIIGKALALAFLEAQAATGFIIDPTTGQKFSVDDSVVRGLADSEFKSRLFEAEKAVLGYCCSGKLLSVFQAVEAQLLERQKGKNILEAQIACGGVIDPVRSVRVPPEAAVQLGLLNNTILKFLHEPSSNAKCFHNPNNRKAMYYCELLKMCLFSVSSKCFLLPVGERKISINKYKEGLITINEFASRKNLVDRVTALRCLEAQVSTGGVIDPFTGKKYSVSEALQRELIDDGCAKQIQQCELIFTGIIHPVRNTVMSAVEAVHLSAIDKEMGMRCLEYQYLTGGLIDPKSHSRLTMEDAIKNGIVDAITATKMKNEKLHIKVLTCPKTKKKITYKEALDRAVFDCHTGLRLLEVNKVIAGVIDQTTGEVLSVFQSILRGFLDYDTGIRLLENQLILSGIISPELGVCYDLEEAKAHALIDEQILLQLQELSNAKKLMSESSLANIPVVSALEQGLISEALAVKILENQLSSGYLILPSTGEKLSLQNAFQRNLISPTLYSNLLERQDTCKDLIDPNSAEKISLEQMVHRSIIHEETGLRLLPVKPQEKGRIVFKCGRRVTILRAAHEGLIDKETMFRLLGAQLMSGGIIDPDSGKRMTVEEAMRQGMIDQDTACGILTHQVQTGGILCQNSGQRLTVDEAVQCNLISSTSALLVLEAQRGFVGLIWPHTGEIFPVSTSLHQDMITNELAFKILNDRKKIAALYIPETCEIISLDKAAESGIIDSNTLSVLTNVTLPDKMPNVEELKSSYYKLKINHNKPKEFYYLFSSPFGKSFLVLKTHLQFDGVQQCLKLTEKMQEHLAVLQDMKKHLDKQQPISNSLEILKAELEQLEVSKVFFMLSFPSLYLQNSAAELSCKKTQLESTAFDVQFFISEHAEDLSPNQSKQLLRLLNTTQKSFQEAQEAITSQVESLETRLQAVQKLGDQKVCLSDQCGAYPWKRGSSNKVNWTDLLNELLTTIFFLLYLKEIQKDMRTSAQTLAEIVKNTETFLKENGEKLSQEDKTVLEQKLNEAKTKCLLLSQKAEESKKELDKAMTTAIKQETEKVAAIEQLEESKNTIENLLDWLSNVDKEAEHGRKFKQVIEQNGTHFEEGDVKVFEGEEDDAQHEKIISQQQAIIVATQSAQTLLEKQGHYLTPEEKDKMQRNMKELKAQYETALAESERKMKLTHSLREELEKFDADYSEFETWLQQAEQELDNLEAGASDFSGIMVKLKRQKSFSEDVISHKGDLRYITISGQRVLDAARSCSKRDGVKRQTLKYIFSLSDDIVERYDNLSKFVNERNEKLQVTLTRSLSVQDGLDEMLDWMEGVEKSLKEQDQVQSSSCMFQMLEQDIAGRQSSINTMNEKVKKFMETADPSTASTLQAKMGELAGRFSAASNKHREKLMKMEELKTKVELFEGLSTKLQSFLDEKNQALSETEAPRKDVSEVSQYIVELAQHKKDLEVLKHLLEELSFHALPGDKALVLEKVNALSKKFKEVEETIKEKEEDVSSCQKQMDSFELLVESLKKWIKETTERIPAAQPSLNTEELKKPLEDTLVSLYEWTLKAPELQKMNSRGTLLCNLITAVTSPAKLRAVAKSGMLLYNQVKLTSVQQAMSNVNHSYEDLGVLLNEKISELESMLSKMQNIQEESASMMNWLQKMDKTASDWEAAPTDSEAVKAQVEQHKLFETELKQSANKVQELKDKVTELLEKNPDSPEAPKWRQTLDKIDSKWKELNQVTSERQQKLEESSNYLIQFQTAEAQLKHWLVEKELMVSVLGPLSIDPNMLNTQKQQVQILLKEFDTRKPQYEQLTMAGQGILERPGEHPPSHEIVKEQLAAVAQKWDSLTSQLKKRCDRIDQAIVKSTEYQSLLRSLSDKLSALDSKLSSSLAVSTQPDAVKQQLEIAKEMKEEIEQEMKNINAAQALCEELSTLVGEEYLKAELTRQLEGIIKSFKDIEQKSDNHVQQLQSAYATSHQFQQMSKDLQAWLSKKKEELNQARPVSAKLDALQSLIEEQKDFKKTMTDQISSYERIVAEGESILQKTQGDDKAELQSQIAALKNNWDEMNKQVKEREDKLTDCLEKALKYKQHVENLQPWIEKCQSNLCELKVGINPVEIEDSIVQVRAWQKDLDKHHGMVELLNNAAESLLNASQTDKEIVQEETKVLNQNVKVVTEQLHKKRECLENMAQRLKEFQESSRETERQLKSAKEHLEAHDSLGPQSFSNKHLTMMQAQQKALQALKPHVDLAKKLAQDLVVEASDSAGVSDLLLQAESLEQEYTTVKQQVEDRCSFLETKLQGIGHFQNSIREMFSQFAEFDDELDSMAPVGRDLKVLQSQREDIKHFMKKLEDLIMNNENANKNCKIMLATEAEASPDLVGIKRDLEALNKQCNKLLDRAKAREDQVEGTICRVEEFYTKLKEFSTLLGRAEEHEESQGPVGMETEAINQQLDTFKVFQKEEIEPLQVKQQEVNWLGQGLIQSAAKSTNTENLEHDLEDVNTRWKTLNKKVAQRAAQLQEALLHCGRFQDALESLLSWLIDTEDLVANQKPPSAEFKVVKAQIQEQKLLQRLLDDRKPTVEAIKREGEKIAESAEPADRVKILKQLSFLDSRWDALLSKAEIRNRQLEGISVVAQQFHEALEPLVEWLTATEKRLANAEPIGTQASKLQQQISQHKALEDDVLAHNKSLHQAISAGQSLKTMSDEVVIVQDKLEGIKARYKDITKLSSDVSKTLEQALQLAGQLHSTHEELCKWLDEVEMELLSYETQIPKGEELSQVQERQKELKKEAKNNKGLVDTLNEVGSAFLELVPWRAREGLDKMITEDNERYRLVSDTISQKVDEIDAAILRSQQFDQAADAEFAWIAETEKKLMSLGDIRLEQDQTTAQLQVQKAFTMEILRHKDTIDELVKSGDKIMKTCTEEEKQMMKVNLLQKYDAVCQMNSERNLQLERAQSLVSQFWETYEELWPWLTETEMVISQLPAPALEYETLKQQQEEHRQLRELIAEHKPHIDKMNKTGPQLLELSPGEGFSIQEKYVAADTLYSKIKEDVKKRALALDEAISQCTQFHDKIDPTLESLKRIVERLRQPPSISAEVEKIKEQISENKNVSVDLEKLQPVYETLKQRGEEMIARSEGADKDMSAKAVQDKLDQMVLIWEDIQTLTEEREAKLLDVMELAEKFWCDHMALVATIKDTQDFIRELEGPGVDPSVVKQQQEAAEAAKEEIDGLQEELEAVVSLGSELRAACGEPDKPIVNKSIDELNSAWDALNKTWKERVDKLGEAMQAAVQYQDGLQALFDWVDIAGSKLASMSPVGTDLETVKQQTEELKQFKTEAYQQQIEMERLNHQAELLLKKATQESDKHTVQDPLSELRLLWDSLEDKIISRQHKLEGALLALGQFQHALDELLAWLTHTEDLLNEQKPVGGDPKAIEIELAKHHVLQNDVFAHQSTVEAVKKAGNDLIESSAVEEASNLRSKLELLNQRWQKLLEKTEQRKQQLDSALIQAQGFHGEVEDLQQWLTDTERQLLTSKPVGGLPETAREQLNAHMELCAAFEAKEETYKCLMQKGQQMLARCPESAETNVEQDINNLKEKWESVQTKLSERKTKLEEALNLAMEFHNSLQDFINWLTQAEQTLTAASRPSLILDTVLFQIDEHKVFATEVNSHRDQIIELDKTGTHLKYFSQKQDVVLIKNLLISVQSRWEKVVQRLVERGRALDDARKRAKQFHEAWHKLMEWLEESEKSLDSDLEIANDPDKIKMQLAQHKEFQKSLGAKHSVYDTTNRTGRSLKEKTTLADDNLKLDDMLSELRDKWDTICGKSVERQNKLEEALLFSGQFTDALQALIDWLYKIEPQLAEDQPVHGDIDLVMNLIDNHKVFQKELGKRTSSVQALKRSARELIEGSRDDSSWVKVQMQELSTRWETVCALSVSKQTRLEQALRQAEEFHSVVHVLLEWLAEAEQALRFHGILPDDEEALRTLIEQHREFMKKLEEKKAELNKATGMGEAILAICHPDSITTIKHWITIIRARFEEVLAWAKQHQQRLAGALAGLIANQELLEALLSWLQWAETTLTEKDKEVIPQEIEEVKALIAEHQTFMEEMTRKQPDVDKVTKTYKRKALEPSPVQSHIPVLDKGRAGRKRSPTPGIYPSAAQAQIETKNPRVNLLVSKWQQVWLLALERRRKLNDALDRLEEVRKLREFANFDFDIWRKKYMRWMNHKKSRVMDFFRRIDKDQDGKITRQEFIDGILSSKFPTSRLEMSAVADIFDRDGDGYIDYYEFVAALHPNKDAYKPLTDADKIEDEVTRQVAKCKCAKRFQVEQIGDNKYRVSLLRTSFGDSQQLRLVRILRSTVMVRVGGGWMALDEFLVKNDPCRAKGRTNVELREKFILADGASQSMAAFRPRGRRSRPSSRGASPNRSTSLSSQAGQAGAPQAGTPIQGSKLRLPGYLSGKGFHSGEDSGILSTAATRVRAQRTPSRPGSRAGSKAGSRSSSRRGSDASDFDISEIQSVCSDMSETVPATSRPTPRAGSRPGAAKPSKIPTPQRRPRRRVLM